jgi:glucan phosphoethanolaminetransferase (alkaline phosphatase superfamily)
MSLFGYEENDTTPRLKALAKNNDNFTFQMDILGANSTFSSVKFMTNAIYETCSIKTSSTDTSNIFKLTKQSGFQTLSMSVISTAKADVTLSVSQKIS